MILEFFFIKYFEVRSSIVYSRPYSKEKSRRVLLRRTDDFMPKLKNLYGVDIGSMAKELTRRSSK